MPYAQRIHLPAHFFDSDGVLGKPGTLGSGKSAEGAGGAAFEKGPMGNGGTRGGKAPDLDGVEGLRRGMVRYGSHGTVRYFTAQCSAGGGLEQLDQRDLCF